MPTRQKEAASLDSAERAETDTELNRPRSETAKSRDVSVYRQAIRKHFSFLKQTTRLDDLMAKSIPLVDDAGFLVPICALHATDLPLIAKLASWRAENSFAFPSQFAVTEKTTAAWLQTKVLDVEDRMQFLVIDRHGAPVGHLGFASCLNDDAAMEVDNVVRGVKGANAGAMTLAMRTLLDWAEEMFSPREVYLRVFEDNEHAVSFYERLGFRRDKLIPLRKHAESGTTIFKPLAPEDVESPDKQFLRMVFEPPRDTDESAIILTAGPTVSARETSYALDAARYGWNHRWNDYIRRFENEFAESLGVKYAISTSSCTGALHIALAALGIGPGDEVIVPDITWVATANAVVYVGATPVFADVQPGSWCIDPASVSKLIGPRTKAIIPVHLYGHPADMHAIAEVASRHNLRVIEDAAPSAGAECRGRRTGTFGDYAAFSFQGAKVAVTGEGGMLVTNDRELYERAVSIWDQGRVPGTFWITSNGLKYKMSNIQAAIGLGQIQRLDELVERKRLIFSWYREELTGLAPVLLNEEMPWARSIYWMTSLLLQPEAPVSREDLRTALKARNVDTRPVFPTISQYPMWPRRQAEQPVAKRIADGAINLPSGHKLSRAQVAYVSRCIREILTTGS